MKGCHWIERLPKPDSRCLQLAENITQKYVFIVERPDDCLTEGSPEESMNSQPTPNIPYNKIEINDWFPLVCILSIIGKDKLKNNEHISQLK